MPTRQIRVGDPCEILKPCDYIPGAQYIDSVRPDNFAVSLILDHKSIPVLILLHTALRVPPQHRLYMCVVAV